MGELASSGHVPAPWTLQGEAHALIVWLPSSREHTVSRTRCPGARITELF